MENVTNVATSNKFGILKNDSPANSDVETETADISGIGERKRKTLPSLDSEDSGSPISKKINQFDSDSSFNSSDNNPPIKSSSNMEEVLESIQKRLDTLATSSELNNLRENLRSKLSEEISSVSREISQLNRTMTERFEVIEGRMFDAENKIEAQEKENRQLRMDIEQLREDLLCTRSEINDQQQYQRRWNLRVFNVPEKPNETQKETTDKLCDIFTNLVGVPTTPEDIEVAHRIKPVGNVASVTDVTMETGPEGEGSDSGNGPAAQTTAETGGSGSNSSGLGQNTRKPIPIIVRFKFRGVRDDILRQRKNLKQKNSKVSISEDLTRYNMQVCNAAYKHPSTDNSWSVAGKIFAKFKNGRKVRIPYGVDVYSFLSREARM